MGKLTRSSIQPGTEVPNQRTLCHTIQPYLEGLIEGPRFF